jgi:trimeric autotransporter adhesin
MKNLFKSTTTLLVFLFSMTGLLHAQAPQKMSFQAVVRNASGNLINNTTVGVKFQVWQTAPFDEIIYEERQTPNTNSEGMISIQIGSGTVLSGTFSSIGWNNGSFSMITSMDPTGGTNYTIKDTSEYISVPYALHANTSGGTGWRINGNSNTVDNTHFLGTTDLSPLNFRVYNQKAGRIDPVSGNTLWGYQTGNAITSGIQNTAMGHQALLKNTTGDANTALGKEALKENTIGKNNTSTGAESLKNNTTGSGNTAAGYQALFTNTTGNDNTAVGDSALFKNTTGSQNTALGMKALFSNTTGSNNTAAGHSALYFNTTGSNNTANGYQALYSNTTGNLNSAMGSNAMRFNTTGSQNTANGMNALLVNMQGKNNVAYGYDAMRFNNNGNGKIALGNCALYSDTANSKDIAIGDSSLFSLNQKSFNKSKIAIGSHALYTCTDSFSHIAIGTNALYSCNSNNDNIAIGHNSLYSNTIGFGNLSFGNGSLSSNTSGNSNLGYGYNTLNKNIGGTSAGQYNVAIGANTLALNTTGYDNTAINSMYNNTIGKENTAINVALYSNISGSKNTAAGYNSLGNNTTGNENVALGCYTLVSGNNSNNTAVGEFALNNFSGSSNTAVGQSALNNSGSGTRNSAICFNCGNAGNLGSFNTFLGNGNINSFTSNCTMIGIGATSAINNKIRIGKASVPTTSVIEGKVAYSYPSDARFKYNIKYDVPGINFIELLNPVTYNFDSKKYSDHVYQEFPDSIKSKLSGTELELTPVKHTGLLAQEIEKICKKLNYDFDGVHVPKVENISDTYSVAYDQFVMPLVKGMQEQQAAIESLLLENATLEKMILEIEKQLEKK